MDHLEPGNADQNNPADAMRSLRMQMLTTPISEFGIKKNNEYPSVYGVLMEFPIGEDTATVVSLFDGNASLYTTSTFGVIGGFAHESVRTAATAFVQAAGQFHGDAISTKEFPYPGSDQVRFYLLTFSGVRVIETDLDSIETGRGKYTQLFDLGQNVLTQLRLTTQQ